MFGTFRARLVGTVIALIAVTAGMVAVVGYVLVRGSLRDQMVEDAVARSEFNIGVLASEDQLPPGAGRAEFEATGLTPRWTQDFGAPFVADASVQLGLKLREHQELAINGTHLVIGEIVLAHLPEPALMADGSLNLVHCGSVALTGLDTYHAAVPVKRMAYAKPDLPPREIETAYPQAVQSLDEKRTNLG